MVTKPTVYPGDGGCWFCHTEDDSLLFCHEFDTYVHEDCVLKTDRHNPEREIIMGEFGLKEPNDKS